VEIGDPQPFSRHNKNYLSHKTVAQISGPVTDSLKKQRGCLQANSRVPKEKNSSSHPFDFVLALPLIAFDNQFLFFMYKVKEKC